MTLITSRSSGLPKYVLFVSKFTLTGQVVNDSSIHPKCEIIEAAAHALWALYDD